MRFACLLADGFEDIEALGTSALLRRAGFEVDFIGVYNNDKVEGSYHTVVTDLKKIKNLEVDNYDGIFLPGGRAAYALRENEVVKKVVSDFYNHNKWMLAICAAPTVYGLMGLLDNKKYISFPGTEKEMGKAIRVDVKAVSDGRFITARSAGAVYDFAFEIIKTINGEAALEKFKKNLYF
ncbi:MAG: DJ-1/PfpI family protein [Candidatus Izemoplasmatales bacterium]|nr:DJ-1/PfpI family protein [Candidatus Izemoplasmatales bacterium]